VTDGPAAPPESAYLPGPHRASGCDGRRRSRPCRAGTRGRRAHLLARSSLRLTGARARRTFAVV